ncbi:MAG: ABC transporter permease, partial [Nocardioides sp.]
VGAKVHLTVSGTAVLPSQPRFPRSSPGLGWVTIDDLATVQPDRSAWRWTQAVRLDDPTSADQFAMTIFNELGPGNTAVSTKAQQRADALLDTQPIVLIVSAYTLVLLVVAFAVAVILVGTRAREQSREIGLLKAIGLTPRQVGRVFAIESGVLGLVGVAVGFTIGAPLAPVLAGSLADTMVAAPATAANPWHALIAAVPVLLVLVVGTWLATLRQSRMSVVNAINAGVAAPARHSTLAHAMTRLGLRPSLDLGLRNVLTARSRAVMLGLALVVTGAALVFALSVKASLDAAQGDGPSDVPDGLPLLVYSLDVVLVLIATLGLIAVTLLTVRERTREFGILKTLGFTPGQINLSVIGGNTLVALLAGLVSLPAGMALYATVYAATGGPSEGRVFPSAGWLAVVVIGLIALAIVTTSLPARLAGRVVVADALRHD